MEQKIEAQNHVFVNRILNMNHIKLIGFDMDYTLATYNVPVFEAKAYTIVLDKLIREHGYPEEIGKLEFNPDFIIRGLVIDTELGNILKVNKYGYVKKTCHGTKFLSIEDQKKIYRTHGIDLTDPRYYIIHTLFSLAEGCIFAQLVDFFEETKKPFSLKKMFNDVRTCLDDAHQEGNLKGDITLHPDKYLIRNQQNADALKQFKKFGKKLALITNSDYEYSQVAMEYCFSPFLDRPWQDLFDIIIVAANKPNFFLHQPKYLKVDRKTGYLSNFHEPIKWGNIYQGGNAKTFERDLSLSPSEILYLGDHIFGDVVTLKEAIGWRTGLIVEELSKEVPVLERNLETHRQIWHKMMEKEDLENEMCSLKESTWGTPHEKRNSALEKKREQLKEKTQQIDEIISKLITEEQKDFNPFWGEVMRAGNEESRFATLVERYACIYMASIGDLANYSPFKYFRPRRRYLAHDPNPYTTGTTSPYEEITSPEDSK